ncbi:MAG: hypothetical protein HQ538_06355 [Parcubacteria group bacterium]|nr:hypothetical protein [Parcubacteria group bacterium]
MTNKLEDFKIGDKVERLFNQNADMSEGDTGEVVGFDHSDKMIEVKKDGAEKLYLHSPENLEIISKGKPKDMKNPTHVVIWDVSNTDPAKFFTSEKDAKEFIKTLSEDTNVSNIILVEIKSVRQVAIQKQLKYKIHKI